MMSLVSSQFEPYEATFNDIILTSIAFGFTLGLGQLTTWTATRQTWVAYKNTGRGVFRNVYIRMIWGEIIVCLALSIICFLHVKGVIPPHFAYYFSILTLWALQVHFLLQIIINRCRILSDDKKFCDRLKIGVAVLITAVNISVYNIWIPARLGISETYIRTNAWWDRVEKAIYMLTDVFLNIYFIRVVRRELARNHLIKYRGLVHFIMFIIGLSLSMDLLIITLISLPYTLFYTQFHSLAYIVKLNIELSMADLAGRIARHRVHNKFIESNPTRNDSRRLTQQQSGITSVASGPTIGGWHNVGGAMGLGFHDMTRPDAVYTVNATTNTDVEPGIQNSTDIHITREFRIDFEDMASQSHCSASGSNTASTSRKENENMYLSKSNQNDYIITDDTPQ